MTLNSVFLNVYFFSLKYPLLEVSGHFDPLNTWGAFVMHALTNPNNVFSPSRMGSQLYGHPPPLPVLTLELKKNLSSVILSKLIDIFRFDLVSVATIFNLYWSRMW